MPSQVLTAPLAIVKDKNQNPIAAIRGFNIQENYQRVDIRQLGQLTAIGSEPVAINCTASFDFNLVKFKDSAISEGIKRGAYTLKDFENDFLLREGTSVTIYKKVGSGSKNAQGLNTLGNDEVIGVIKQMYLNSDSMSLSEGGVGSRSQSYTYLEPILFNEVG